MGIKNDGASVHSLTPRVAELCGEDTAALYGECAALWEEAAFNTHEMNEEQRETLKNLCGAYQLEEKHQILPASGSKILRCEILSRKSRPAEESVSPLERLSYHLSATVNISPRAIWSRFMHTTCD